MSSHSSWALAAALVCLASACSSADGKLSRSNGDATTPAADAGVFPDAAGEFDGGHLPVGDGGEDGGHSPASDGGEYDGSSTDAGDGAMPASECTAGTVETRVRYREAESTYACDAEQQTRACLAGKWGAWDGTFSFEGCTVLGHRGCDAAPEGGKESRVRYGAASVAFGEHCMPEMQARSCSESKWSSWSGSFAFESCVVEQAPTCNGTPSDGVETRERYEEGHVVFGASCRVETQVRTCQAGAWSSWSGSFAYASCAKDAPRDCGDTLHGGVDARVRYQSSSVPFGAACKPETQTRTCDDGAFGAWTGSYAAETCTAQGALACPGGVPHGGVITRTRYENESVPFSAECHAEVQTRKCDNGTFGPWNGTFTFETCDQTKPKSCDDTPSGGKVSRVRYASYSVPFDSQCAPEVQGRTCANGVWSDWSGTSSYDDCTVEGPLSCGSTPSGGQQTRTGYEQPQVRAGSSCNAETQVRTCDNGAFGEWGGTFAHPTCEVLPPRSCDGTPHGGLDSRTRYRSEQVSYGGLCDSEAQTRRCDEGTWSEWSGTFTAAACVVGQPRACGEAAHGTEQTRTRYFAREAVNRSCQAETQRRVCQDGAWSDWTGSFGFEVCSRCDDADGDLHGTGCTAGGDCNDREPTTFVGAKEVPWNFVDEDCDGKLGRHLEIAHRYENRDSPSIAADGENLFMFSRNAIEVRKFGAIDTLIAVHPGVDHLHYDIQPRNGIIAVQPGYGADEHAVLIYDFRDVTRAPRAVARIDLPRQGRQFFELSHDGRRLYIKHEQLDVYDLSDPSEPVLLGTVPLPYCPSTLGSGMTLVDNGRRAYLSCQYSGSSGIVSGDGVFVSDTVQDMTKADWKLLVMTSSQESADIRSAIDADAWWVINDFRPYTAGLYELDLSNPAAPRSRERPTSSGTWPSSSAVTKDRVLRSYYDFKNSGLCVFERAATRDVCTPGIAVGSVLLAHGTHAVLGAPTDLTEYDLTNPKLPVALAHWRSLPLIANHTGANAVIRDGFAYAGSYDGLAILDLDDFTKPVALSRGESWSVAGLSRGYVYTYDAYDGGAFIVDARDPSAPSVEKRFDSTRFSGAAVVARGGTDFLMAGTYDQLRWWSLSTPSAPSDSGASTAIPNALKFASDDRSLFILQKASNGSSTSSIVFAAFDGRSVRVSKRFGEDASDLLLKDHQLYWTAGGKLNRSDADTGATLETLTSRRYLSHLWDMDSVLLLAGSDTVYTASDTLWTVDDATRQLLPVPLPTEISSCSPMAAGDGLLLCDSRDGSFVLRVVE